ncbi:hypothetical protein HPB47_019704 [Ixodes persulcatus]|uniref:Uncharacterized protein n=1 Tax=Ixodes persulcatus TaxID=34615 RepID=A0AC60QIC6_IXOPE|nr:hypothetical protein HPB47_019704 [Ixodes persulcatus]
MSTVANERHPRRLVVTAASEGLGVSQLWMPSDDTGGLGNGGTGACLPSLSRSGARRWAPGELRRSVAGAFNEPRAEVATEGEEVRRWTQSRRHLYGPEYDAGAQMSALPWKRAPEDARARARPRAFSAGPAKRGPVAHAAELSEGRGHGRHDAPFGSEPEGCERRNSGSTGNRIE